jgi:DNA repair protein RadA/Sms
MAKTRQLFRCSACDATSPQWAGRCSSCGEWNTLAEDVANSVVAHVAPSSKVVRLTEVSTTSHTTMPTEIAELDRVLSGGFTPGSVTLLGGEPGIGKSTLVLQLCDALARQQKKCLVVTGEESAQQVAARAERLGLRSPGMSLLADNDMETILATIQHEAPDLCVIDSVQTMNAAGVGSATGSATQVRECAQALTSMAKSTGVAVLMVGHVTKEGTLAGPRVLEHVVDTVLEFEGDRHHDLRMLRAVKHRFGATDEVGVMEMTETGLASVRNASGMFLDDRRTGVAGSIVVPIMQGRRALMVELQTLTSKSHAPPPRRIAQGIDGNRMTVVLAVLGRRAHVWMGSDDVYVSIVGGVRVDDPGADLALALAAASSKSDTPIAADLVAIGELGLAGEVRKVSHIQKRLTEVANMGFVRAIVPKGTPEGPKGLRLHPVETLRQALDVIGVGTVLPESDSDAQSATSRQRQPVGV